MAAQSAMWSVIYAVGMLSVFVGERLIGAGSARSITGFGVLLVLLAAGLRLARAQKAKGHARSVERSILGLYGLGVLALLLYFLQSDLATSLFAGKMLEKDWPRLAVAFAALWPALALGSLLPLLLVEMAYASVARAPQLESLRIRDAMLSGLGLAGALVFAFSLCYVASERDKKLDLSYFRTARPGESTRKIARTLDQPVQVSLFFPPASEVKEEVLGYFNDLKLESKMVEVATYDHAIDPAKAKELGVSGNGIVVVSRGQRREQLSVGTELEAARSQLRNLDKEIQKRFLQVARPGRTVYLTTGHGERSATPANDTDKRATIKDLREALGQQGYAVRELGAAEGLAADVPKDAAIVMIIGPRTAFLPEEVASLSRYLDNAGRVFLALDPNNGSDTGWDAKELLGPLGLKFNQVTLANDQIFAARFHQPSDRANIATGSYSSHPAVTTLGRLGMRAPLILLGAGSFEEEKGKPSTVSVDFAVRAHPATWNDINGNYQFDSAGGETRKGWQLAAALTKKKAGVPTKPVEEGRLLALGDSDAVSDEVLRNPGNAYLLLDGVKWLLGDEAITGEVSSEVDTPIQHTHKEDVWWFYSTIFLAPMVTLGLGWAVMRRRRGAAKKEAA
jgi:hypothetical protein